MRHLIVPLVAFLAGCAQLPALLPNGENRQLAEMLAWSQRVLNSAPDEQRKELARAGKAFSTGAGSLERLRLALLLAQPGSAIADEKRAATLLEPFAGQGNNGGALQQFGGVLHAQVSERMKEQRRAQQYREQMDAEQKRSLQYREQLDALRALERNLRERSQKDGK